MPTWSGLREGRWSGYPWTKHARGPCDIDPYLVWADLTNFADLIRDDGLEWIPLLLRLNTNASQFVTEVIPALESSVRIAPVYGADASPGLANAKYCVAAVTKNAFGALLERGDRLKSWIEQLQLGIPVSGVGSARPGGLRIEPVDDDAALSPRGKAPVVVGVIDEGFAFAHERFREPDQPKTRIEAFWDQGRAGARRTPPADDGAN